MVQVCSDLLALHVLSLWNAVPGLLSFPSRTDWAVRGSLPGLSVWTPAYHLQHVVFPPRSVSTVVCHMQTIYKGWLTSSFERIRPGRRISTEWCCWKGQCCCLPKVAQRIFNKFLCLLWNRTYVLPISTKSFFRAFSCFRVACLPPPPNTHMYCPLMFGLFGLNVKRMFPEKNHLRSDSSPP